MVKINLIREKKEDCDKIEIRDHRGHHFTTVDDEFIDKWIRLVGVHAAGVYLVLCRHSGVDKFCWPGMALISDKLGISPITVKRAVKTLEQYRIIKVERPRGRHNIYHLIEKSKWKKDLSYYRVCGTGRTRKPRITVGDGHEAGDHEACVNCAALKKATA